MGLSPLLSVLVVAVGTAVLLSACKMHTPLVGWATNTPWTHVVVEYAENYRFNGRVVDARTGEPLTGATVRLELVRLGGNAGGEMFYDIFGFTDKHYHNLGTKKGCNVIDTLGSRRAYPKINDIYQKYGQTDDIRQRQTVETDSTGDFTVQSTVFRESVPETGGGKGYALQRIVVKKGGYKLFSQGVFSKCEEHLQALKPVELQPESGSER